MPKLPPLQCGDWVQWQPDDGDSADAVGVVCRISGGTAFVVCDDMPPRAMPRHSLVVVPSPDEIARESERLRTEQLKRLAASTVAGRSPSDGAPHTYRETARRRGVPIV